MHGGEAAGAGLRAPELGLAACHSTKRNDDGFGATLAVGEEEKIAVGQFTVLPGQVGVGPLAAPRDVGSHAELGEGLADRAGGKHTAGPLALRSPEFIGDAQHLVLAGRVINQQGRETGLGAEQRAARFDEVPQLGRQRGSHRAEVWRQHQQPVACALGQFVGTVAHRDAVKQHVGIDQIVGIPSRQLRHRILRGIGRTFAGEVEHVSREGALTEQKPGARHGIDPALALLEPGVRAIEEKAIRAHRHSRRRIGMRLMGVTVKNGQVDTLRSHLVAEDFQRIGILEPA